MRRSILAGSVLLALLIGCGGQAEETHREQVPGAGGTGAAGTDASGPEASLPDAVPDTTATQDVGVIDVAKESKKDVVWDVGPVTECPATPPTGSCKHPGDECWYGTDPRIHCRTQVVCNQGTWELSPPDPDTCWIQPSPDCPEDAGSVGIGFCQDSSVGSPYCLYGTGTVCGCQYWGVGIQWDCYQSPGTGCPELVPNAGTDLCSLPEGEICMYGFGCSPYVFGCVQGYWYVIAKGGQVIICN